MIIGFFIADDVFPIIALPQFFVRGLPIFVPTCRGKTLVAALCAARLFTGIH